MGAKASKNPRTARKAGRRAPMRLFDDYVRTDHSWARRTERGFGWWDRSAKQEIATLRATADGWFSRYPAAEAGRLVRQFRSEIESEHQGALFELFIHEHLRKAGFAVRCHPRMAGTDRRPDFLGLLGRRHALYVEATRAGAAKEAEALEQRRQEVIDVIDSLRSPDFFVSVVVTGQPRQSVPVSKHKLRAKLKTWLDGLDYDTEVARRRANPYFREEQFYWEAGGLELEFNAYPRPSSLRGAPWDRLVDVEHDGDATLLHADSMIANALKSKATRYGKPSRPYLVAINVLEFPVDADDVEAGLESVWGTAANPKVTRVSGVLLSNVPNLAAAATRTPVLVLNPHARKPLGHLEQLFKPYQGRVDV